MLGGLSITQKYRVNEKIRSPQVRLIDEKGKNLGILEIADAIKLAEESELDLVEVSPDAKPPVCRILDYGKLKYQQKKKVQQKKKQKNNQKEMRFRPRISEHDFLVKQKQIQRFLEQGNKVQITMNFRGREMAHVNLAKELLSHLAANMEEIAKIEREAKLEGRKMIMLLIPK